MWRQGRALNGDAMVFYDVEIFMSFSSIWDVCVVVGHMMTVWQGFRVSEVWLAEISQWKGKKMNNKTNK